MNTIVKGLLKDQEERMAELEKGFVVERRTLGEKLVLETTEALIALGCEDLLEGTKSSNDELETKLMKALNEIEVLKTKCKEVSTLKASLTKANKAKDKKDARIKELEMEVKELKAKQEVKVETKIETIVDTKEIERLQKELEAEKKKYATLQRTNSTLRSENNKLKDTITELEADTIDTVVKKEDVFIPPAVKEELTAMNIKFKNKGTKLYESETHYVMAKSNVKDLVIIPKKFDSEINLESDGTKYESILVDKFNFDEKRHTISPVNVYEHNEKYRASFSRTEARESLFQFSYKDVFAGYICCSYGKTYLWSWDQQKSKEPYIYDFGQRLKGKDEVVYSRDRERLTKIIKEMNKKYLEGVEVYSKDNGYANNTKEEAIEKSNKFDDRIAQLNAMQSEFGGLFKNNAPAPVKEKVEETKPVLSDAMSSFADKMF